VKVSDEAEARRPAAQHAGPTLKTQGQRFVRNVRPFGC
jgi:hypothetical protein